MRRWLAIIGITFLTAAFIATFYVTFQLYGETRFIQGANAYKQYLDEQKAGESCRESASLKGFTLEYKQ